MDPCVSTIEQRVKRITVESSTPSRGKEVQEGDPDLWMWSDRE